MNDWMIICNKCKYGKYVYEVIKICEVKLNDNLCYKNRWFNVYQLILWFSIVKIIQNIDTNHSLYKLSIIKSLFPFIK